MTGALYLPSGGLNVGNGQLVVDSGGRVLMPNRPAFSAWMNNANYSVTTPVAVLWNNVTSNIGSCYSTSTGRFTAPIAGMYFFSWQLLARNVISGARTSLYKNSALFGTSNAQTYSEGSNIQTMASASCIVPLSAGDYVEIRVWTGGSGDFYGDSNSHNSFSGHQIG